MVSPDFPERGQDSNSLQEEASATPESWFFAWLKSAGLYLGAITAYLTAATTLVVAWKKFVAGEGETADLTIWALAAVLTLPLLLAFLFNIIPSLRRRRERNLRPTGTAAPGYFSTAPREDDPYQFFAKGYEPFLEWAASPKAPLLHLTGLSGSGKSSLIGAYLKPRLASMETGPNTIILTVRSYADPLASMKEALLVLWKKIPSGYQDLSPLEALSRAARQLSNNDRLLIAFDQFEEFFLLRTSIGKTTEIDDQTAAPASNGLEAQITQLHDFLHAFMTDPPERVTLLLSYREDHHLLLAPLDLPARQERKNWMIVEPFNFATATTFLQSCPGLKVPETRMRKVLREAAHQEGARVIMRPIVANLLGLVLQQMSGHPTLWRRTSDLLRGYVRDCLGDELKEERARILRVLLTDFQTAQPRSIAEVSRETGIKPAILNTHIEHLGRAGLLRCLTQDESDFAQRTWQIAHDFLANLTEHVLDGLHRSFWRTVRPWLAPTAVAIVVVVSLIWPWVQKHRAISFLSNSGFTWNEQDSKIKVDTDENRYIERLNPFLGAFRRLNPRIIYLSGCSVLQNMDGLQSLSSLQSLSLMMCNNLQNLDGLKGLTSLVSLDLRGCGSLQNVDGLRDLTSLHTLNLGSCDTLQNVDGLKGLTSLVSLDLRGCVLLQDISILQSLAKLEILDLSSCSSLQNVDGLQGLSSLKSLDLSSCSSLQNVDGLRGLTSLEILDLGRCYELQNLDGLKGLTSLRCLNFSLFDVTQNVDKLKHLSWVKDQLLMSYKRYKALPKENWNALSTTFPDALIIFPDGSIRKP